MKMNVSPTYLQISPRERLLGMIFSQSRADQTTSLCQTFLKKLLQKQLFPLVSATCITYCVWACFSEKSLSGEVVRMMFLFVQIHPLLVISLHHQCVLEIPQFAVDVFMAMCQVER